MPDELTTTLELPPGARTISRARSAYRRFAYEVRHPENHKQLVRFLCVGASGYIINLAMFAVLLHVAGVPDKVSFVLAAVIAATNNFWWNRHWTFGAKEDHPFGQAVRFFAVSFLVLVAAAGIYALLVGLGLDKKVVADGIAWIIATPISFLAQKLWSFKA
ncbi:MAG TPA: GtrA family protein [Solirubrobacteraceae bacterium]|nr:GtrA family protein [Solirubrobacteraceae bacterium]